MRYYLLRKGVEFVIYRVKGSDILAFLRDYEQEILLESNSLLQLLILFEQEYLFNIEYLSN